MYRVAYVTGSRAEYGIVKHYLNVLHEHSEIKLELLVTGTHLEKQFGYTIDEILSDGFNVTFEVPLHISTQNNSAITKSMAIGLEKFGNYFANEKYDLLIILGDRYEMLSVAIAAAMNRQPILHIHGGEKTLGNYDEFIRHAITKMSTYHFTATEEYSKRVIQLGENPKDVYNLGALGADNALRNIDKNFIPPIQTPYLLILFHPETLTKSSPVVQIEELLSALDFFVEQYHLIFVGGNADTHSEDISKKINQYIESNDNTSFIQNVDNKTYQNILANAAVYIGNSSSGIIESPTLRTYSVNIGDRQKGRIKSSSTIDSDCTANDIVQAINKSIKLNKEEEVIINPYYRENTLENYVATTLEILKKPVSSLKDFYDLNM